MGTVSLAAQHDSSADHFRDADVQRVHFVLVCTHVPVWVLHPQWKRSQEVVNKLVNCNCPAAMHLMSISDSSIVIIVNIHKSSKNLKIHGTA